MSKEYARSGGMEARSGPSGSAKPAIAAVTSRTTPPSTATSTSTWRPSLNPRKTSPPRCTGIQAFSWFEKTSATSASKGMEPTHGPISGLRRLNRIPTPIPRKLAIRTKLLKKPT